MKEDSNVAKGMLLTKGSCVSHSSLSDTLFGTPTGSLCSVCSGYRHAVAGSMHLAAYALALEKELARHIHLVALFIDYAHVILGVAYKRMVLSVHPDPDLEGFCVLVECFFTPALLLVDYPDIIVRFGHERMFLAIHPDLDLEAFVILT